MVVDYSLLRRMTMRLSTMEARARRVAAGTAQEAKLPSSVTTRSRRLRKTSPWPTSSILRKNKAQRVTTTKIKLIHPMRRRSIIAVRSGGDASTFTPIYELSPPPDGLGGGGGGGAEYMGCCCGGGGLDCGYCGSTIFLLASLQIT